MATSDDKMGDTGEKIFIGKGEQPAWLTLALGNRHGLVTGATGTGKTVSLQVMAEGFARAGVPVFAADIKGDLSGISEVGEAKDFHGQARRRHGPRRSSPTSSRRYFGMCSASRAIRCALPSRKWDRSCCRGCWI